MEKWGEMGGKWGNVRKCQKYLVGSVEKTCEIRRKLERKEIILRSNSPWGHYHIYLPHARRRKLEENRRKMRQLGTNFPYPPIPFFSFFHSLATFPSGAFD